MTWIGRLRLFGGLLGVVALVSVLTLVFNHRQTQAASVDASVGVDQNVVGSAYGGTVIKQFVKDGDSVTKGQRLFTIMSIELRQDVENGLSVENTESYDVNPNKGTVTYKAVSDGTITDLAAKSGSTVPASSPAAKINVTNSQFVLANYVLSPRDYERVQQGAAVRILLPNDKTINGTATTVKVQTEAGKAQTQVRIDSDALKDPANAALAQPGTPVVATLSLRPVGPLAEAGQIALDFARKIGVQ